MYKKTTFYILFFFLLSFTGWAQTKTVTGKVTAKSDPEGLIGVVVYPKSNGLKGTQTDIDGNYSITVSGDDDVVIFKIIGFSTQEIKVNGKSVINVVMTENTKVMQEAVVVGNKIEKKIDVLGNVSTITAKDINNLPTPSFEAALQGRAPGVQITTGSGVPGAAVNVRVRGTGSISAGSVPLYIVDGMPITSGTNGDGAGMIAGATSAGFQVNALASINPNDIESIEVLKDAASASQYGARGANGVVIITTKRGKAGKTKFDVTGVTGVTNLTNRINLLNGPQYISLTEQAYKNTVYQNFELPNGTYVGAGVDNGNINANNGKVANVVNTTLSGVNYLTSPVLNLQNFGYNDSTANNINTNWMNILLRQGSNSQVNLNARGGNERTQFYVGGTYTSTVGNMIGNSFQRMGGSFNIDNAVSQRLKIGLTNRLTSAINNIVASGGSSNSAAGGFPTAQTTSLPIFPIYWSQLSGIGNPGANNYPFNPYYNAYPTSSGSPFGGSNIALVNDLQYNSIKRQELRNIAQAYAEYKLSTDLVFRSDVGIDFNNVVENVYNSEYIRVLTRSTLPNQPGAYAADGRTLTYQVTQNNKLFYNKDFSGGHNISLIGVETYNGFDQITNLAASELFSNDYTRTVSGGQTPLTASSSEQAWRFLSFYGGAKYKYKGKYLAEVNMTRQGSSRFGVNNRWGMFPSYAVGWIVSEEEFMKDKLPAISLLKLRGSFGYGGNAQIGSYSSYGLYNPGATYNYNSGISPSQVNNPNLTWERSRQIDISMDLGLFKDRINTSVTYFNKTTYDMLLAVPAPPSAGITSNSIYQNIGSLRNSGWEFALNTKNIVPSREGGFSWTTDFNITFIHNKVLDVGGLQPTELTASTNGNINSAVITGYPIGTFYIDKWAGVDPTNGREMLYDLSGKAVDMPYFQSLAAGLKYLDSLRQPISGKSAQPKFYGSIQNTLRYKGFDLIFMFYYSIGNYILDDGERQQSYVTGQTNLRESLLNYWTPTNTNAPNPAPYYSSSADGIGFSFQDPLSYRNTTRFLHDGSYVRLRQLTIGYTVPSELLKKGFLKKSGITSLRIYGQGMNLLTFTKFPGWDPEVVSNNASALQQNLNIGVTSLDFPQLKSYTVGINVQF